MQRFFVPAEILTTREVRIVGETARQIIRVLRMKPGDRICLLDGLGWEYLVTLTTSGKDDILGEVTEKRQGGGEPAHCVTLYLSLLNKPDKLEWALQKCTEIGAAAFVPVRAARSISDIPGPSRVERWQRIIQEAAEQCGRSLLPALGTTITLPQALSQEATRLTNAQHIALMPTLGAECTLTTALQKIDRPGGSLSIFIGPEGGFTNDETKAANDAGIKPITLGPRTLRAETAAVASLTMALYELGEMS